MTLTKGKHQFILRKKKVVKYTHICYIPMYILTYYIFMLAVKECVIRYIILLRLFIAQLKSFVTSGSSACGTR